MTDLRYEKMDKLMPCHLRGYLCYWFDVKSQKWTELAKIEVHWPEWSRHSDYIYFLGVPPGGPQGLFRIRISDGRLEQLVSLKDDRLNPGNWVGLAPDDSPLLLRDTGAQDIYALDWEAP